ncbi:hypothetical protein DIPPA_09943 [Diplonema papillatum]|nr:hypothetical protein DIPPA_09943 [Diplonema papillatum]
MSSKEVTAMLVQHAQCMEDRRHELLEVVRKRVHSWKTSKDLPPPKRIALTPLKLESLNVGPAPPQAPVKHAAAPAAPAPQPAAATPQVPAFKGHPPTPAPVLPPTTPSCTASPSEIDATSKATPEGCWWDSASLAAQLEKQDGTSPSAVFEPRLSPINATAIYTQAKIAPPK